jgi:hypothetical protein
MDLHGISMGFDLAEPEQGFDHISQVIKWLRMMFSKA